RRAWGTILRESYPDRATLILNLPPIDLRSPNRPLLEFRHWYDCEPGWDGGRVEISEDGGMRWRAIAPVEGYPEQAIFALDEQAGFSGRSDGWVTSRFDLSSYVGGIVRMRLVFKSDESNFRPYAGWFIDDLSIPPTGNLTVRVRRADDGVAILGAFVSLGGIWTSYTDPNGRAYFGGVPAGRHRLRVYRTGFVESVQEVEVVANENREINVALETYNSRLVVEPQEVNREVEFGEEVNEALMLQNLGDQPAIYRIWIDFNAQARGGREMRGPPGGDVTLIGGRSNISPDRDEPWQLLATMDLTRATGEQYFYGAHMVATGTPADYLYVTTAGDFGRGQCSFYWFNRQGELVRQGSQPWGATGWGIRDLAYDENWIYGAYDNDLVRYNPLTGARVATAFRTPLMLCRAVTFSPEMNAFWVGNADEAWYLIDHTGQIIDRW
ncbi:MAG: carboxypeptidase regulatory-like domain-containing protein, partial [bacterium]